MKNKNAHSAHIFNDILGCFKEKSYLCGIEKFYIGHLNNIKQVSPRMQPYIEEAAQTDYWNLSKESKKEKILALYRDGVAKREIARIVGQSESCVRKWLKEMQ